MQRILVLGAGFAGLWGAVGAARRLDELGVDPGEVEVLVVNRTPWHSIRVRNYEANLNGTRVPLADVLGPIGVKLVVAKVTDIDIPGRKVTCEIGARFRPWLMIGSSSLLAAAWLGPQFRDLRHKLSTSTRSRAPRGSTIISLGCHLARSRQANITYS